MKPFNIETYLTPSYSFLSGLKKGAAPNALIYSRQNPAPQKEYQHEGKVIESAVFYPNEFDKKYVASDVNTDTKGYKFCAAAAAAILKGRKPDKVMKIARRYANISLTEKTLIGKMSGDYRPIIKSLIQSQGRQIISTDLYDRAKMIRDNIYFNSPLEDYLKVAHIEELVEWKNKYTSVPCRGYPDISNQDFTIDFKTGLDVSPNKFASRWGYARKYGYLEQVTGYAESKGDILKHDCIIFAVEKNPPYNWAMYSLSDWDKEYALIEFSKWCAKFKFIQENDLWDIGYEFDAMYRFDESEFTYVKYSELPIYKTSIYDYETF